GALLRGLTPPPGFNHGFLFLLPKKDAGLISDTRPLSVTNTDNRLLACAVARAIMPAVSTFLDPAQKGFLAGINGHSHIEDLNEFFYQGITNNIQRFVFLLDTAKAFDSIALDGFSKSSTRLPSLIGSCISFVAPFMTLRWPLFLVVPL